MKKALIPLILISLSATLLISCSPISPHPTATSGITPALPQPTPINETAPEVTTDQEIQYFEDYIVNFIFNADGVTQTENRSTLADRMEFYRIPGVSVSVIQNNEILWTRGYGIQNASLNDPVTKDTIFQAGSVSKFVTALLVFHYVEEGLLDLDENINTYLTSWTMPENKFGKPITLRMLLSHQSGLPATGFSRESPNKLPTLPDILSGEPPALNQPAHPVIEPGTSWMYSNIGYVVIQMILEDTTGKSFNEIATDIIFEPLRMQSSTFSYPLPQSWQHREAWPHSNGAAKPAAQDSNARAQGGLMTTTNDMTLLMIEFMKAFNGEASKLIEQDSARQMLTTQTAIPLDAYGVAFDMGLGVFIDDTGSSISFLHTGYSAPGSAFIIVGFPETEQAVVMGINGDKGDQLELEILSTLVDIYDYPGGEYFK